MAYVMNPNTFKLGYSQTWSDSWYSNNKLYPLMLNAMLNVRFFISYMFNNKRLEKIDIYLSSLEIGLNSGCLYISLFFYDTKLDYKSMRYPLSLYFKAMNPYGSPRFYKFFRKKRLPKHKIKNKYYKWDWYFYDVFIRYPWWDPMFTYRPHNKREERAVHNSQRFFLFFDYLGFTPDSFIFEYYKRNFFWEYNWRFNRMLNKNRLVKSKQWLYVNLRETYILYLFYSFLLEKKTSLNWLSDDKDDLHLMRFLRYLFFYGRMPFWGRRHRNLTVAWDHAKVKRLRKQTYLTKYRIAYNKKINYINYLVNKKNSSSLKKRKKFIRLLGDIYLNLFFARIYMKNKKRALFGLPNNDIIPSFLNKKLKRKYKVLLSNVKSCIKKPKKETFLWYFNFVENNYYKSFVEARALSKTRFYSRYIRHELNMKKIRAYWDEKGVLARKDVEHVSKIDYYLISYFTIYHEYLPFFKNYKKFYFQRAGWVKFWKKYLKAYEGFYKKLMIELKFKNVSLNTLLKKKKSFDKNHKFKYLKEVGFFKNYSELKLNTLKKKDRKYFRQHKYVWSKFIAKKNPYTTENINILKKRWNKFLSGGVYKKNTIENRKKKKKAVVSIISENETRLFAYLKEHLRTTPRYKGRAKRINYGFDIENYFMEKNSTLNYYTKLKMRSDFLTMNVIRFSYARMFFMVWLFKMNTQLKRIKPYDIVKESYYKKLNIYETLYLFYFILIKRPFLKTVTSYLSVFIKAWLGFNTKFNFYILTNNEITSNYIARHIAYAFQLGYKWRDVVRPIRRDLNYLLTRLRFLDYGYTNKSFDRYKHWASSLNKNLFEYSPTFLNLYLGRYFTSLYISKYMKYIINYFYKVSQVTSFRYKYEKAGLERLFFTRFAKKIHYFNFFRDSLFFLSLPLFTEYLYKLKWYYTYIYVYLNNTWIFNKLNLTRLTSYIKFKVNNFYHLNIDNYRDAFYSYFITVFENKIFYFPFYRKKKKNETKEEEKARKKKEDYIKKYGKVQNRIYFLCKAKKHWLDKEILENNCKKKNIVDWRLFFRENNLELDVTKVIKFYFYRYRNVNMLFLIKIMYSYNISNFRSKHDFFSLNYYYKLYMKSIIKFFDDHFLYFFKTYKCYCNILRLVIFADYDLSYSLLKYRVYMARAVVSLFCYNNITVERKKIFFIRCLFFVKKYIVDFRQKIINWIFSRVYLSEDVLGFHREFSGIYLSLFYKVVNDFMSRKIDKKINLNIYVYLSNKEVYYNNILLNKFINLFIYNRFNCKNYIKINKLLTSPLFYFWKNTSIIPSISKEFFIYDYFYIKRQNNILFFYFSKPDVKFNLSYILSIKKYKFNLVESLISKKLRWYNFSQVIKKKTFIDYFYKNKIILGYKLRLAGRFRRRRKRTIVWVKRGMLPIATHEKHVDYGQSVRANKYSTYSIRVWIYRNDKFKHKHFLKF